MSDPYAGISRRADDPYSGIARRLDKPPAAKPQPKGLFGGARAFADTVGAFAQSATEQLPFLDEAAAWTAAKLAGASYEQVRGRQKELAASDREKRPTARNAGGVAGFATALAAPGGSLLKGAKGAQLAARSAALGGGYGALYGAGAADGGLRQRAGAAALGGALGAGTGAAMPAVANAAAATWSGAARAANSLTGGRVGAQRGAVARLGQALKEDKLTPEMLRERDAAWRASGASTPALADLAGENTRAFLRMAAMKPGEGRNLAVEYADVTRENLADRAIRRTEQLTPRDGRSAVQLQEALQAEMQRQDAINYPLFEKAPIDLATTRVNETLSGKAGERIMKQAREIADARRDELVGSELDALGWGIKNGTRGKITAGTLDLLRRAAREAGDQAAAHGDNSTAGGLFGRAGEMESRLLGVEGFGVARKAHEDFMRRMEAIELGGQVFKASPGDYGRSIAGLTADQRAAAQVGGRQHITDALGGTTSPAGVIRKTIFGENAGQNLNTLYDQAAGPYQEAMRNELNRLRNANFMDPNAGSKTSNVQSDNKVGGDIVSAFRQPVSIILTKITKGLTLTDAERGEAVRLGLSEAGSVIGRLEDGSVVFRNGMRLLPDGRVVAAGGAFAGTTPSR